MQSAVEFRIRRDRQKWESNQKARRCCAGGMDGGRTVEEYCKRPLGDAEKTNCISQDNKSNIALIIRGRRKEKVLNKGTRPGSTDNRVQRRRFWLVEVWVSPLGMSGDEPILLFFHECGHHLASYLHRYFKYNPSIWLLHIWLSRDSLLYRILHLPERHLNYGVDVYMPSPWDNRLGQGTPSRLGWHSF